jgi:beta-phosphoglucomutase-like phosphatase (HAD superfamily)
MPLSRRSLLKMAAVGAVTGLPATLPSARGAGRHALKAVAFDAFTTFDTRSIDALTEQALVMAAKLVKVTLSSEKRDRLMQAFLDIKAWPDAAEALRHMKDSGLKLAFLANATPMMLDAWISNSELNGIFEPHLSTDKVQAFKPDPRVSNGG